MTDFTVLLKNVLRRSGIELAPGQIDQLACHWKLLGAANREFNLTAVIDPEQAAEKHYLDSLLALPALAGLKPGASLLDLGAGGGFPGLALAVARPGLKFTLLDATSKKCGFLRRCAEELQLANVTVVNLRAEEAGRDPVLRGSFDAVTARAVAALRVLAEYALPLLKTGGLLVAMKGPGFFQESRNAENAFTLLGGASLRGVYEKTLPVSGEQRAILTYEKNGETPEKYPRRPGLPAKRPL